MNGNHRQAPGMTVEFVDRKIISRPAYLEPPLEPRSDSGFVWDIVSVTEQPRSGKYLFAAGVITDLQIDPRFRVTLAQPFQRGREHDEVPESVIREHKDALDSRRVEYSLGSHPQAQLQPALDSDSYRRFQDLLDEPHFTSK